MINNVWLEHKEDKARSHAALLLSPCFQASFGSAAEAEEAQLLPLHLSD